MGRPKSLRETADIRREIKFTPTDFVRINEGKPRGMPLSTFIRTAALEKIEAPEIETEPPSISELGYIPLLGHIQAGEAAEVVPFPPDAVIKPPDKAPTSVYPLYALHVHGSSMTTEDGTSIPDDSIAMFEQRDNASPRLIVHVEFEEFEGVRTCTLKQYLPNFADGSATFMPLNPDHKPITKKAGEYVIRGAHVYHWQVVKSLQQRGKELEDEIDALDKVITEQLESVRTRTKRRKEA